MSRVQRARRKMTSLLFALGISLSVMLFGGLYLQMASGNDPALNAKKVIVVQKEVSPLSSSAETPSPAPVESTPS